MFDIEKMARSYIEAAIFTDEEQLCEENQAAQEWGFSISESAKNDAMSECERFYKASKGLIEKAGLTEEQAGHDLWLTRNGHGAGFWDRGLGDIGEKLNDLCGWKTDFKETHTYLAAPNPDKPDSLELFFN